MSRDKVAGIEIETSQSNTDVHVFPRETRRGKAQWAIWVKPDGSGVLFVAQNQIALPKNGPDKRMEPRPEVKKVFCTDSACSLRNCEAPHQLGPGCRLY